MRSLFFLAIVFSVFPFYLQAEEFPLPQSVARVYENKGQWDEKVQLYMPLHGAEVFLGQEGIRWKLWEAEAYEHHSHEEKESQALHGHNLHISLLGANAANWKGEQAYKDVANFYLGDDPKNWAENVGIYGANVFENAWQGITMRMYGKSAQELEYDFVLEPNANPAQIQLQYEGADALYLKEGVLYVQTSVNTLIEKKPQAFQYIQGVKTEISCNFVLQGNILSFQLGNYDKSLPLLIDPTVIFSTYTGSTQDNWGFTATYDNLGNAFSGGIIYNGFTGSTGYPTTTGAFQLTHGGGLFEMVISKFDPTGANLLFSTYLGGNASDMPHSLITNAAGELYVFGRSNSTNFPANNGYDTSPNGGFDIVITRFSATGAYLNGTYLGGGIDDGNNTSFMHNYGDDSRGEVMLDAAGNCYIASSTSSPNIPVSATAFQPVFAGTLDAYIAKLSPDLTTLIWASFLGMGVMDAAYGIKVDSNEDVYVTGATINSNMPGMTGWLPTFQGSTDGFVYKIKNDGTTILAGSYVGTAQDDRAYFIELDDDNEVYLYGQTMGAFPVVNATYSSPNARQFILKLSNDLSTNIFSSTFGNSGAFAEDISPTAFLVDDCENLYISGWGGWLNPSGGSTTGLPVTSDAFQSNTDGSDFYLAVFEKDMQSLLYGTFWGGNGATGEHVDGGTSRFDHNGVVYQAVCAGCGGNNLFPTTSGAWSTTNNSGNCNLGLFKIEFDYNGVNANFATLDSTATIPVFSGCAPLTIFFDNNSTASSAATYYWELGTNGATSTLFEPIYTYAVPDTYHVMMIVTDLSSCNGIDTAYADVIVYPLPTADAGPDQAICNGQTAILVGSGGDTYLWNPGAVANDSLTVSPSVTTSYTLTVTTIHGCTDTDVANVTINNLLTVNGGNDPAICEGFSVQLSALASQSNVSYTWIPGTGLNNQYIANPIASPSTSTTYVVQVDDGTGCIGRDTLLLVVNPNPVVTLPQDITICPSADTTLSVTYTVGGSFLWTPATWLNDATLENPIANPPQNTEYVLTITSTEGCIGKDSLWVEIAPIPDINAGSDVIICPGDSTQLFAGTILGQDFQWHTGLSLSDSMIKNPIAFPLQTTQYTVTTHSQYGCANSDSMIVTVRPYPQVVISPDTSICDGSTVALGVSGGVSYLWEPIPGLSSYTSDSVLATPFQTFTYYVTVKDSIGCRARDSVRIEVVPIPWVMLSVLDSACLRNEYVLLANGNAQTYVWSTGDSAAVLHIPADTLLYTNVTAWNGQCRGNSDTVRTTPYLRPIAEFTMSQDSGIVPVRVVFDNLSVNAYSYVWDFGDRTNPEGVENPRHNFEHQGEFVVSLIAYNDDMCADTFELPVKALYPNLNIPSAFTPNGDNVNDSFYGGHFGIAAFQIRIYDRWGAVVYESSDKNFRWDGKYKNQDAPEGVFVWQVNAITDGGENIQKEGTVTLLR